MTELTTQFFDAVRDGDASTVRDLAARDGTLVHQLNKHCFNGPALNMAAGNNDLAMVEALIDAGADLELKSDWWAGPWSAVQSALNSGHTGLAEYLVERGAVMDAHAAAGLSRTDMLAQMLDDDPTLVHRPGGDGCLPLHFAGSVAVAELLLECGAELDARDVDHYSTAAQYLCKRHADVSRFLLDRGSVPDIFVAVMSDHRPLVKRLVATDSTVLQWRMNQTYFPTGPKYDVHNIMTFIAGGNATPLHAAVAANRGEMLDQLVELGMDVNQTGAYDDCTALHLAAWENRPELIERLLAHGADVNQRSGEKHNNSPAGWAIVAGSFQSLRSLLAAGAEVLPFFEADAAKAAAGEFRQFGNCDSDAQQRIVELLRLQKQ